MKKLIIILFLLIFLNPASYADYYPTYTSSFYHFGKGVISFSGKLPIYELDNEKSPLAAIILNSDKLIIKERGVFKPDIEDTFIVYLKDDKEALLTVENDTDEWYYVCYNHKLKLFGWVKKADNVDFIPWNDFYNSYGRKYGLYIFRDVKNEYKKLHSSPNDDSSIVDEFKFPKHISLWLISGDWVLVKVTGYDGITKTGWMRWRLKNGTVLLFVNYQNK